MIKKNYYATDKQGNCVNRGFYCFNCSHWYGYFDSGGCDMIKTTSIAVNLGDIK